MSAMIAPPVQLKRLPKLRPLSAPGPLPHAVPPPPPIPSPSNAFSATPSPSLRPNRMGQAHGGNHRRHRSGHLPPGERRSPQVLVRTGHQGRRLQILLRRTKTPPNAKPPSASSSTASAAHCRLGHCRRYFDPAGGELFYDELTWLCVNQYGAFNSPVWFNVASSINTPSANPPPARLVHRPPDRPARTRPHPIRIPQGSACFIPVRGRQHGEHHATGP